MIKVATLLVIAVCLMVVGCQPPEGMAGVSQEDFDAMKTQVEALQADVANLMEANESLTDHYNEHVEKFHKGGTTAPKTTPTKPPQVGR